MRVQRMFLNILEGHASVTEEIYAARKVQQDEERARAVRPRLHRFARRR